ncbi:hypothetical protein Tco_0090133 [Tanacetum coccineum]
MSSWKGNLPKLPIIIKYSAIGTRKYSGRYLGNNISGIQLEKHLHSWFEHGNLIDDKSISSESNGLVMQPGGARAIGVVLRIRSIWNSTWRTGGRPCRFSRKLSRLLGASCTPRKVSCLSFVFNILFVLNQGGNMSPDTFLPSILLLVVIIVTVVVTVIVDVAGGVPSIIKLSFMIIDFFPLEEIPPPKDTKTPVESPIPISPSSSVGSSSPVKSTTPSPDYPFDESIVAELDNSYWIIPRPLGSEPVPEESNK